MMSCVAGCGLVAGERDEALEAEAEVAQGVQVVAQGLGDAACADDEDVAGLDARTVARVDAMRCAVRRPASRREVKKMMRRTTRRGEEGSAGEIERAAEDQAGDERRPAWSGGARSRPLDLLGWT